MPKRKDLGVRGKVKIVKRPKKQLTYALILSRKRCAVRSRPPALDSPRSFVADNLCLIDSDAAAKDGDDRKSTAESAALIFSFSNKFSPASHQRAGQSDECSPALTPYTPLSPEYIPLSHKLTPISDECTPLSPEHYPPDSYTPLSPEHYSPDSYTPLSPERYPPDSYTPLSPERYPTDSYTPLSPERYPTDSYTPLSPERYPTDSYTPLSPEHYSPDSYTPSPRPDYVPFQPKHRASRPYSSFARVGLHSAVREYPFDADDLW